MPDIQRKKFVAIEDWTALTLVYDFDPTHPASFGESKYGPWTLRVVEDNQGVEWSFFASGGLLKLLDYLDLNRKGQQFQIRKRLDDKNKVFYQIETADGLYDTKVGAVPSEKKETAKPAPKEEVARPTDVVDTNMQLLDRIIREYISLLKKICTEEGLLDDHWQNLYRHEHVTTVFITMTKNK